MVFKRMITNNPSEISVALFLSAVVIFITDLVFSTVLGFLIVLGYLNFWSINYLFNAGVYLFFATDALFLLSYALREFTKKT